MVTRTPCSARAAAQARAHVAAELTRVPSQSNNSAWAVSGVRAVRMVGTFRTTGCRTGVRQPAEPSSGEAEAASSGGVEVLGLEAVVPVALVVLVGEVARAGAGDEGLADGGGVLLVAGAPGSGGGVHDVAPPPLVGHPGGAVGHVRVPPHGGA